MLAGINPVDITKALNKWISSTLKKSEMTISYMIIAVNIAVLLVLTAICICETRNVNEHIRYLTIAMRLERWRAEEQNT